MSVPPLGPTVLKDPPRRKSENLLMGDLSAVTADRLRFLVETPRDYGPLVMVRFGPVCYYLVTGSEFFEHIFQENYKNYIKERKFAEILGKETGGTLATSSGAEWLWRRRLMQPDFYRAQILRFVAMMVNEVHAMLAQWDRTAAQGRTIPLDQEMKALTMQIIGRAMFSIDMSRESNELYRAYTTIARFIIDRGLSLLAVPLFVPTKQNREFKHAEQVIITTLSSIIAARGDRREHRDLLDGLLAARAEEDGRGFTQGQLMAEMSTLIFAGHETTATTLTWLFSLLARHPEVEERLHTELVTVLADRDPTADDLKHLPYATRVIQETMRLYPAAFLTLREAISEDVLGPYRLPAGGKLLLNIYGVHHRPDYWPDPERFDPDRFDDAQAKPRPKLAYLPFGAGPRKCIGEPLAMTEMAIVLAILARRYRFRLPAGHTVVPEAGFALQPRDGLPVVLEPRRDRPHG